jgi:hypothetical protein
MWQMEYGVVWQDSARWRATFDEAMARNMPRIIEFPTVVQDILLTQYGDLFANEPERRHFAEYLTGLFIAERKIVSGINREFAVTTDQSCLNRWITEVDWDEKALNQRRLELLQRDSATHYTPHGVIAIDNTLIDHDGKLIEDAGWFWDHADQRHRIAHDENDRQLCLCLGQTLSVGVPALPQEGSVRRRRRAVQESLDPLQRTD